MPVEGFDVDDVGDTDEGPSRGRRAFRVLGVAVVGLSLFGAGLFAQRLLNPPAETVSSILTIRERSDGEWYISNKYISVDYNKGRLLPRLPKVIVPAPSTCEEALTAVQGLVSAAAETGTAVLSALSLEQRYSYEQHVLFAQYLCTYDRFVDFFSRLDDFVDVGVSLATVDSQGSVG